MTQPHRLAAFVAVVGLAAASASSQRLVTPLTGDLEPLKSDFNRNSGSPRLLVVLSPT